MDQHSIVMNLGFELREWSAGMGMQYFLLCSLREDARWKQKTTIRKREKHKDWGKAKVKQVTAFFPCPALPLVHFLFPHPVPKTPHYLSSC